MGDRTRESLNLTKLFNWRLGRLARARREVDVTDSLSRGSYWSVCDDVGTGWG